jgi:LysM repeat protein
MLWPRPALAQSAAQEVLNAINAARAEHGLTPLVENPLLTQAAQGHVNDMITNYVYGHYGSDGSSVQTRVIRTGYSATPWVSENWVSASSPNGAMRWWMGDYIHRVNILTARWVEIGVGVGTRGSEMIFVTVFSAGGGTNDVNAVVAVVPPQEAPPPPSVRIEQVVVPPEGLDYTVKGGDTLLAIGLRYGLPWERIAEANGLNERSLLQIGQLVRIPGSGASTAPPPDVPTEEYTVQPNDTLYTIAARRNMYWDEVAAVNGFNENTVLQIGQVIQVPVVESDDLVETTRLVDARRENVGPIVPEQSATNFSNYSLLQFDPAQPTAPNASVDANALVVSTGIGGPTDSTGIGATSAVLAAHAATTDATADVATAEIAVTVAAAPAAQTEVTVAAATNAPTLHTVQAGDTIISIAAQHGLEWGALLALNGLTENSVLQPGQTIRLR